MSVEMCGHCGAVFKASATSSTTCGYCGAEKALPALGAGQIHLTNQGVLDLLRQRVTGVNSTFLHPSIPQKKLANVRRVHAAHLPADEPVIGIYDGTAFGSANDGWAITARRLYFKNQMEAAGFLEWKDIEPYSIDVDGSRLVIGRLSLDTLFSRDEDGLYAWSDVLDTLSLSARPAESLDGGASYESGASGPVDAGWGGPEVAVASSEGWGGTAGQSIAGGIMMDAPRPQTEHFAQKPYAGWFSGVSVVDTHPSGEIVAAACSGGIELRYANNGALFMSLPISNGVLDARFSPDGQWLLTGEMNGSAGLFNVRTGAAQGATPGMKDSCAQVVWLGGSERFAMASQVGELWIVDARSVAVTAKLLGQDPEYRGLGGIAASADGSRLFVSVGERLGCFDTAAGQIVWRNDRALRNHSHISVSPDGAMIVAGGYDGIALFDARTGQPGPRCAFPCASEVCWPEVYEDEGMFGRTKKVVEQGTFSWSPKPRFSPRGDVVVTQDHTGNLAFLDLSTMTLHPTPREHGRAWIEDVAWFRDGNHVLLGMSDNSIAIWSVQPLAGVMRTEALADVS